MDSGARGFGCARFFCAGGACSARSAQRQQKSTGELDATDYTRVLRIADPALAHGGVPPCTSTGFDLKKRFGEGCGRRGGTRILATRRGEAVREWLGSVELVPDARVHGDQVTRQPFEVLNVVLAQKLGALSR